MKEKARPLLFLAALSVFVGMRMLPIFVPSKKAEVRPISRIEVPEPLMVSMDVLLHHPWLKEQPKFKEVTPSMANDLLSIHEWHQQLSKALEKQGVLAPTEEELLDLVIDSIHTLQEPIPFSCPKECYNVLNLSDVAKLGVAPHPFQLHQQLLLGESSLGLPVTLDIRAFPTKDPKAREEIRMWHLDLLDQPLEQISQDVFLGYGELKVDRSHGFASIQGERGLFLAFAETDEHLYIAYLSAVRQEFLQAVEPLLAHPLLPSKKEAL